MLSKKFLLKKRLYIWLVLLFTICFFIFDFGNLLSRLLISINNLFSNVDGEIKQVMINSDEYDENSGGNFKITKSADWIDNENIKLLYEIDTIVEPSNNKKDVILILDKTSGMTGSRISKLKKDTKNFISQLLLDEENKVGIIAYNRTAEILSPLTNDEESLIASIDTIVTDKRHRSYYEALVELDNFLTGYKVSNNRDLIVVLVSGGFPSVDVANHVSQYNLFKSKYPSSIVYGVVYETDESLKEEIKNVSDEQLISMNYDNSLLVPGVNSEYYENFEVIEYIDNDYFYVETVDDINVSIGSVEIQKENNQQKIIWKASENQFRTGNKATMEIELKLNSNLVKVEGLYPISTKSKINYKLEGNTLTTLESTNINILKNGYNVVYDENLPKGCKTTIPDEIYYVNDSVDVSNKLLECEGWQFRGWEKIENVEYINDEIFIMPSNNLSLKAKWSKLQLNKSMTGSVFESVEVIKNEVINFYEMYIHQERFSNVSFFSKSSVIPNYTGVDANNSIGFSRTTGVNNDINIAALNGNYSKAMTLVLDFYSSHVSFGDKTSVYYEALLSSRTVTGNGITLWYHGFLNRLVFDPGGHEYRTYYDLEENPARYLFVYTYGGDYNGVIIINKTTKKVLTISPQESNSSLIFEGFSGNDYEMSFGGESNQVHDGAFYQSGSGLKFYSFYLNDKGVTRTSLNELLLQFGYDFSKADISSIKS